MSNIDKQAGEGDVSPKTYYIHPMAFGGTQNPGYGHVPVVHADDFEKQRAKLEAAEKRIAEVESQRRMAFMACNRWADKFREAEKRISEQEVVKELFLRAKALMYQSGGTPIENSLNPIDAWLYDAERAAAAGKGEAS
jgi:hypothetical protein